MRKVKSAIGWLCLLSLVTAVGLFVGSTYIMVEPFWSGGATIYRLPPPDVLVMAPRIAEGGITDADSTVLEKYTRQVSEPEQVWRGFDAAVKAVFGQGIVETDDRRIVAAAAVLDEHGRVVAAHPRQLVGKAFPFSIPLSEIQDSQVMDTNCQYWSTASSVYPYWTGSFAQEVSKYLDEDLGEVYLARIKDRNGRVEGVLAVAAYKRQLALNMPYGTFDRPLILHLQAVGIAALILHLLLLPVWVGMDAHWRGMRPFAWGALVALTSVIGLAAYLVARLPGAYSCPNCGEEVIGKYVRCPACGVALANRCPICQTRMKPGWQYCPVCNISPTQIVEPKPPTEPLASRLMESTRSSLQVTVVDAETGAPMPNTRVSVSGRLSKVDGMTSTTGFFEARRLRSGRYTVTVTRAGYEPAEAELEIGDTPESVQLNLRAMPSRIIGRVVERGTMRPVAGVRVYIDSGRLDRSTLTGGEGGFVLEDIPAGPYTVAVDSVGFKHQTRLAEVAPGQQVTLDFSIEPSEDMV